MPRLEDMLRRYDASLRTAREKDLPEMLTRAAQAAHEGTTHDSKLKASKDGAKALAANPSSRVVARVETKGQIKKKRRTA